MTAAEDALRIAERITALRTELAALEGEFYRLFGGSKPAMSGAKSIGHQANGGAHAGTDGSIAVRFKAMLKAEPSKTFSLPDVFARIPDKDAKSIRGTVGRLARERDGVKRTGRGKYRYLPSKEEASHLSM
jgi:hypothetical protein